MTEKNTPVLVTTECRGVFFGYLDSDISKEKIVLTHARNCLYWTSQLRGFVGLAETGPVPGCKIGPKTPRMTLFGITSVLECTPQAVDAWESAPWG